jgi:hypothetical protein
LSRLERLANPPHCSFAVFSRLDHWMKGRCASQRQACLTTTLAPETLGISSPLSPRTRPRSASAPAPKSQVRR